MKPASATTSARVRSIRCGERGVERVARREGAVVDDLGGDAAAARERQAGGVGAVAEDGGDARVPALARARADDRLHVGAASGDEDDDVLHRRPQCIGATARIPTIAPLCPSRQQMSDPPPVERRRAATGGRAPPPRRRVLSGMRPTGAMHLGHWHGALKNWVRLQDEYECFFFAADWHALTTHYEEREVIESSVYEMVTDWLAAGLDPDKATLFIQSRLPEHAELFTLLAMGTPLGWLERDADLQGPDREAEGPRPRDLRLPRLPAAAGRRHPDLQGRVRPGRRRPGAARRDHARGRAPLQPPLRPRGRLRRARRARR